MNENTNNIETIETISLEDGLKAMEAIAIATAQAEEAETEAQKDFWASMAEDIANGKVNVF